MIDWSAFEFFIVKNKRINIFYFTQIIFQSMNLWKILNEKIIRIAFEDFFEFWIIELSRFLFFTREL